MCKYFPKTRNFPSQAKNTPPCKKSSLGPSSFFNQFNTYKHVQLGPSLLQFCAISVSSLGILVTLSYVSHDKNFNVLVYVEDPVTGHDVLGGKLH